MSAIKKCNGCGEVKPLDAFGFAKDGRLLRKSQCKQCRSVSKKFWKSREVTKKHFSDKGKSKYHTDDIYRTHVLNKHADNYRSVTGRAKHLYLTAKKRAQGKKQPFDLSLGRILMILSIGRCQKTGLPFDFDKPKGVQINPFAPSLDKIDPFGFYTDDNVQIVIDWYNRAKGQCSEEQLRFFCSSVINNAS